MAIRTKQRKSGLVYFVETRGHWERVGYDKREAERVDARRKKEVKAGTFQPKSSGAISVGRFLQEWVDGKTNRGAAADRAHIEKHVLTREWFAKLKMGDARPPHFQQLIKEIKLGPPKLKPKYIANIYGSVRAAFRTALRQEVITRDVCLLEPGTISKKSKESVPYTLAEARAIMAAATGARLIWLGLAFYTGMRCGEVCGRRWRDWDPESKPLGGLAITTQYNDQPLKGDDDSTDRPRRAPVHPDLARLLDWWWREGFELAYLRKPTLDDFIVERLDAPKENLTRSMTYKALESDRKAAGVAKIAGRGQHATRHTFLTQARRASPQAKELAERITHNAEGEMVDNYTHWEWEPLCSVISAYPSLLADSETAPGSAPGSGNQGQKPDVPGAVGCSVFAETATVSNQTAVRVLESELKYSGLRDAVSEPVSEDEDAQGFLAALEDAAERGLRGLRPPAKTRPYIARDRAIRRAVSAARAAGKVGAK